MDYDDPTPAGVIRETWRWLPAAVVVTFAVLLLGGLVTLVCWQAGWWFAAHDATRQAQLTQNGYSNQTTLRGEVTTDFGTLTSIGVQIAAAKGDPSMVTELKTEQAAGSSLGTYVICLTSTGAKYLDYWEGDVFTVSGAAEWDTAAHSIKVTGAPTAAVHTASSK